MPFWNCDFQSRFINWYLHTVFIMPRDLTDDNSTLVQVMAWCRQATSHYLSQCWPSSMSPYSVTRPQWLEWYLLNWYTLWEIILNVVKWILFSILLFRQNYQRWYDMCVLADTIRFTDVFVNRAISIEKDLSLLETTFNVFCINLQGLAPIAIYPTQL